MKQLEELNLHFATDATVQQLHGLPSLKRLTVHASLENQTIIGFAGQRLEELHFSGKIKDPQSPFLTGLVHLRELEIGPNDLGDAAVEEIAKMDNLEVLRLTTIS